MAVSIVSSDREWADLGIECMYLKQVSLENVGPVRNLNLDMKFDPGGGPKPLVVVGRNGSGKSLFLAHIANALIASRTPLYDDVEVTKGKVFKARNPAYIQSGQPFFAATLRFVDGFFQSEVQLDRTKLEFENHYGYALTNVGWQNISDDATSHYDDNFHSRIPELRQTLGST